MASLQCTIALTKAISVSCSLVRRTPLALSVVSRSAAAIMNNRQVLTTATAATTDLDALFKQKRALRSKVKKELNNMSPTVRSQEDTAIQNIILEAPWFKSCKRLCAYISCSALREVDTSNLLKAVLNCPDDDSMFGKRLYVPRVEDKNRNMRMLHISRIDDLVANSMNILEPTPVDAEGNECEDVMLANDPVDLILLPGLAFDRSGKRLGRGGGYYDTFLMRYQGLAEERKWKQPLLVALSYSVQMLEEGVVPVTSADIPVDAIVTSSGVVPINPAALGRCH